MKAMILKVFAVVFAVLSLTATSVFADFPDMPADPVIKSTLEKAVENGLLTGYENGEIRPYDKITRAQMAAIIVRAFGAETMADISKFPDMNPSQWHYDSMSKAVAMEAFQGDGVNLNPEANITFQEAFAVLARIFDLQTEYQVDKLKYEIGLIDARPTNDYYAIAKHTDAASVADWAKPTTEAILEGGYWIAPNNTIRPAEYINRSEFAILMNNLVTTYIDEPGTYDSLPEGNVVVRSNDVIIDNLKGDYDIYVGDCVKSGVVMGDGVDIDRLVIRSGHIGIGGIYNFVRIVGHNCIADISYGPTVKVQLYIKHLGDCIVNLGNKELG